jgi:hypothetical protein
MSPELALPDDHRVAVYSKRDIPKDYFATSRTRDLFIVRTLSWWADKDFTILDAHH